MKRWFLPVVLVAVCAAGDDDSVLPLLRAPETAVPPTVATVPVVPADASASDVAAAVVVCRQLVAERPRDVDLRVRLADLLVRAQRPAEAAAELAEVWAVAPAAPLAVRLIELRVATGAAVQAAVVAEEALGAFPDHPALLPAAAKAFVAANLPAQAGDLVDRFGERPELQPLVGQLLLVADRPVQAWQRGDEQVREQLRARAVGGAGLLLFLPSGWRAGMDGAQTVDGTAELSFAGPAAGDPAAVAREQAAARFGAGMAAVFAAKPPEGVPPSPLAPTWTPVDGHPAGVLSVLLPMPGQPTPLTQRVGALAVPVPAGAAVVVVRSTGDVSAVVAMLEQLAGRVVAAEPQREK